MNKINHRGRGSVGKRLRHARKLEQDPEYAKKMKEYQEKRKHKR